MTPEDRKYTKEHEWIKVDGKVGVIGITQFAQGELGDIVFLDLPRVGTKAEREKPFGSVEAVKTVSDLYAPVSGTIVAVNDALVSEPDLVNKDPYGKGWMVKIEMTDAAEANSLLSAQDYQQLIGVH
ncbi:MAG: glycine cleavage system protein GcvH [bacterium]